MGYQDYVRNIPRGRNDQSAMVPGFHHIKAGIQALSEATQEDEIHGPSWVLPMQKKKELYTSKS